MTNNSDRIRHQLAALYGPTAADSLVPRLNQLMSRAASAFPQTSTSPEPLCERDTLLITYPDQLREPGLSPLAALDRFLAGHVRGMISGVHLLPFYPWSSDDGFSVKDYFAVEPAYGTWEDIRRIGQNFDLMFDAVFNHLSAQSDWFQRFLRNEPGYEDFFVTVEGDPDLSQVVRPRTLPLLTTFPSATGPRKVWTTFSADQVDLNFKNPAVLLRVIEALLCYVRHGARFIRLDAIAFLWKEVGTSCLHLPQTHRVIQLLRSVLDCCAPHVRLITETNVPHADNISYFGDGTNEAQLVYNFALPPLVLHSLASGNASILARWANTLRPPSNQTAFFNFLASHDGIGLNPARGILTEAEIAALVERTQRHGGFVSLKHLPDGSTAPYELNINYFDALSDPAAAEPMALQVDRFLCAHALMLAIPGVPAIYFHSLFGSRGDRPAAESSGIPRRINRQKLERAPLELALSNPGSLRFRVFSGMSRLLQTRRGLAAFHPNAPFEILDADPRLFLIRRSAPDGQNPVLCLHNLAGQAVDLDASLAPGPAQLLLSTVPQPHPARLAPYEARWLREA